MRRLFSRGTLSDWTNGYNREDGGCFEYFQPLQLLNKDLLLIIRQSQMKLNEYAIPKSAGAVSVTAYTHLVKASWILVDIISCHPQISFLGHGTRYEIPLLSAVSHAFGCPSSHGILILT